MKDCCKRIDQVHVVHMHRGLYQFHNCRLIESMTSICCMLPLYVLIMFDMN